MFDSFHWSNGRHSIFAATAAILCLYSCSSVSHTAIQPDNLRIINHWDNLDGTVERGYAGRSLWQWDSLPGVLSPRYDEYARLCSLADINGIVLNNVNASPLILSRPYLEKVASLASVFRPYGVKTYLSVNFASPMVLDSLDNADPLNPQVALWWKNKVDEIYSLIPDFGGFLVKANSEGQPGPCDYGRTHADGANMLAAALKPHNGIVMWRAFVYSPDDDDRAKQAYKEFKPLDGHFDSNVIIQIKNGPVDFQPREPYSPLFTAMSSSNIMAELQITQEYMGHSNHLVFLAPMWKEFFGYVNPDHLKGIAGVANIGNAPNFTAHPFAGANFFAFGRLSGNPSLSAEEIAREWVKTELKPLTKDTEDRIVTMMLESHEACVDYMMPMGLHHIFAFGHHYGPEPWCEVEGARPDWLPRYYHRADKDGIGFDRTDTGSNAVAQYPDSLAAILNNPATCPEGYLLWFHHLPWTYLLPSTGETLWEALCRHYERGTLKAEEFIEVWSQCRDDIPDTELWQDVANRLKIQAKDARWWKDACLLYFQELNGLPFPDFVSQPVHSLDSLKTVDLGIDNFTSPSGELLDSVR